MRRSDREISENLEMYEIVKKCEVCRVAFFDEEYPYIIPLNFGVHYEAGKWKLYFHGANEGAKLKLIQKNPKVAFEMDCSHQLILGERACDSTYGYESICGNGTIHILGDHEKAEALNILMEHYQTGKHHKFGENELKAVTVFELNVNEIHGKRHAIKNTKKSMDYNTLRSAVHFGKEDRIDEWVLQYLEGVGKNISLASRIKSQKRYYMGPVKMKIDLLDEPNGAPVYIKKEEEIKAFFDVANRMTEAYEAGWDMPPLIVEYTGGRYVVNDGKHRLASLRSMGFLEAAAILWTSTEDEYDELLNSSELPTIF